MAQELRRLTDEEGSDFERDLLRSGRFDAPPPASRGRALVALGLATSAAATTVATGTAAATATATATTGTVALVKWIAGGVIAGALAVGSVVTMGDPGRVPQTPPVVTGSVTAREASPAVVGPSATGAPVVSAPKEVDPAPSAAPAPAAPAVAPSAHAPTLAEEVASLDAARTALAAGDASRALRAVDDHDRRFPGGALGPEATVVRIEALALRGDRATATRLANAFLAAHPHSPHASRLRSLLGLAPADP